MSHYDELSERLGEVMDRLACANRRMERMMTEDYTFPSGKKVRKLARRIHVLTAGYAMLRAEQFNKAA